MTPYNKYRIDENFYYLEEGINEKVKNIKDKLLDLLNLLDKLYEKNYIDRYGDEEIKSEFLSLKNILIHLLGHIGVDPNDINDMSIKLLEILQNEIIKKINNYINSLKTARSYIFLLYSCPSQDLSDLNKERKILLQRYTGAIGSSGLYQKSTEVEIYGINRFLNPGTKEHTDCLVGDNKTNQKNKYVKWNDRSE